MLDENEDAIPGYLVAANNHNTGNLNEDTFASAQPQRSFANRAYNMIGSAAYSGLNSFYNTAVWAGNWFSDKDAQYRDTRKWIASYDEDMAKYYDQNRQAADILGFVAGSFVPGLGGVKVFNGAAKALTASREGVFGVNMSRGLGVLPGARETLVREAVESYATTRTAFSYSNPQTLKAIASGFGEQALQAAAFETAVAVTMKKSPILTDLDAGDMISNIASGAILGGAIGGAIEGALTVGKIKQGLRATDEKLKGVTQVARGVDGTAEADNILIRRNDLDTLAQNAPEGVDPALYQNLWEQKIAYVDKSDRQSFTKIAGNNPELGNLVYEGLRTDPTGSLSAKVMGLERIGVMRDVGDLNKKFTLGSYLLEDQAPTHSMRYLKLWGEDAGKLSDEAPSALHLADTLKANQSIEVRANRVIAGENRYDIQLNQYWNPANASYEESLARNIWAMDDTVTRLQVPKNGKPVLIGENDIPILTKAYREGFTDFRMLTEGGQTWAPPANRNDLLQYISNLKLSGARQEMEASLEAGGRITAEQVANKYDIPLKTLTGEQVAADSERAVFGLLDAQVNHFNKFHANTPNPPDLSAVKPWLKQQNHPMVYKIDQLNGIDNFQVEAMTVIAQRQKIQQAANDIAVTAALGERAAVLGEFTEPMLQRVNRGGAGAGMFSFSNANYGTAGSLAEHVGALTTRWIREAEQTIGDTFANVNQAVLGNANNTVELASVMQRVRAAGSRVYVRNEQGDGLILREFKEYYQKIAAGDENAVAPLIPDGIEGEFKISSPEVMNWINTHISTNGRRTEALNNLRGAKSQPATRDPEAFYPPAPNPDRFKYHAFVTDDAKITSTGHTTMLYADSAQSLERQIAEARAQGFNAYTKDDTANYFKARGLYDYTLGLNESQMDSALRRSGTSAPAFPITGTPQEILQDIMQWHAKEEAIVIREAVSTKYSRQFGTLKQMGDEYAKLETSRAGFLGKFKKEAKNPFEDYVKTFLGASLKQDYPLWTALNNFVDEAGTRTWNAVSSVWNRSRNVYDLEEVNKILDRYGIQMAATPAQMEAWVNHPAGTAAVSKFVQSQNAILSSLVLRLDPINALNNAIGSPILVGAETSSVLRMIRNGAPDAENVLSGMMKSGVPGTGDSITTPAKMYAAALKDYFSEAGKPLLEKYKKMGFVTDTTEQFKQLLEVSTIRGTETAAELQTRTNRMYELAKGLASQGEKWTGNRLAEEMNRFVSAHIMDKITGVAVQRGLMDEKAAGSFINTFVNRTQGNIIASQRPQLFQGPIGQAIGLFQSYQFNIMQQLLRYVGEGQKKDALTLLGLQSTIYGMNGLPGFQAINQHIIGTASGNTSHTDAYNSVNNIAGKTAGDWLMYGAASNMLIDPDLKINLYSRGDINPRQVTIVPTNIANVPAVAGYGRLFGSIKDSLSNIANGGDVWNSILSGIEQQGINRPLAGLARVARGADEMGISYSTSGKGNVVSANDFYSLANFARLTGAKPFDEAIRQDAVYRIQAYQGKDREAKEKLGKAIKTVVANGSAPTQEQMENFIERYAKLGGKQEEFNRWYVQQLKAVSTPQANKLVNNTSSPYSQYMQSIMGGRMLNTPQMILQSREEE